MGRDSADREQIDIAGLVREWLAGTRPLLKCTFLSIFEENQFERKIQIDDIMDK